jgi:hypothetical protein
MCLCRARSYGIFDVRLLRLSHPGNALPTACMHHLSAIASV